MASITTEPNGRRTIQFVASDGRRKSIRLGKCDQKTAQAVRTQVERLAISIRTGTAMPESTAGWLADITADLRRKLVAVGLIEKPSEEPARNAVLLGEFLSEYIRRRVDAKPGTVGKLLATDPQLRKFFGDEKPLPDITPRDADNFRLSLKASKTRRGGPPMPNTLSKHIRVARLFFNNAVRHRLIEENPFSGVASGDRRNAERE